MPFCDAAEYGTRKVIGEHATIGMLVSSDGTVGEIRRSAFEQAEERIVHELLALEKPFAVVLNSQDPSREESVALARSLEEKYGVPVALVNCLTLTFEDICGILSMILGEFPVTSVGVELPTFARALEQAGETEMVKAFVFIMENYRGEPAKIRNFVIGNQKYIRGRIMAYIKRNIELFY